MNILLDFLKNFWSLINDASFYILIGLLCAGLIKMYLKDEFIKKHIGQNGFWSNIKAALLGIPLPLCSCGVIPFISSLKNQGASKSSILTFLISTPITGVDSIAATYGVFGWFFTIFRVMSSVVIALFAGFLSLIFDKETLKTNINMEETTVSCCAKQQKENFFKTLWKSSFDEIFKEIVKPLIIGIFLGAIITTFIPPKFEEFIQSNIVINYALVLAIAVPVYVCATSSIPFGISLLLSGFTPGAVFVFLSAGPATNAMTISVIYKILGKKSLVIYLASIVFGSLIFGIILDLVFANELKNIVSHVHQNSSNSFLANISSVILIIISLKYTFPKKQKKSCYA